MSVFYHLYTDFKGPSAYKSHPKKKDRLKNSFIVILARALAHYEKDFTLIAYLGERSLLFKLIRVNRLYLR